jgi:hypothetical protein
MQQPRQMPGHHLCLALTRSPNGRCSFNGAAPYNRSPPQSGIGAASQAMLTSTRPRAEPTACTPAVADSDGDSANTTDDTLDPGPTRPACHRPTTFTPAIADSVGGSLNTADHALDCGANHPAGDRGGGIAHPGRRLTRA